MPDTDPVVAAADRLSGELVGPGHLPLTRVAERTVAHPAAAATSHRPRPAGYLAHHAHAKLVADSDGDLTNQAIDATVVVRATLSCFVWRFESAFESAFYRRHAPRIFRWLAREGLA